MFTLINKHKIYLIIVLFILILGFILRRQNYDQIPLPGESRDEYSFTWLGLSLFQLGKPIATSGLDPYNHDWQYINVDDVFHKYANPNPFPVDGPWFDHPPLFGLFAGALPYLRGYRNFADISTALIRKPMIFLGIINLLLIIIFSTLVFSPRVGLITGLIYATNPLFVVSSRMVQAENLLITLFLLALISLHYRFLWLSISFAGLAVLVKISGLSVCLSLIILTFIFDPKPIANSLKIFLGTFAYLIIFPIYGYFYDWSLFKAVFSTNSDRYYRDGLGGFYSLITKSNITRDFVDGWVPFGWLSLLLLKLRPKSKYWWVVIPLFSYLVTYLIFGSHGYGWYKFPFYPFVTILVAIAFAKLFTKYNLFTAFFALFVTGGVLVDHFYPPENLQNFMWSYRFSLLAVFLILLYSNFNPRFSKYVSWIIFISLIIINIWANFQITPTSWYKFQ